MSISFPGVGLDFPYVGKSLRLLGIDISYYGILIAIGMVLALSMMILEAKRRGQDPNHFLSAMIVAFLLGTVCSRAFYVACYWPLYEEDPFSVLWLRGGGMAIYGAILGGWLGVSIVARICHAKAGRMLDIIAPSLLLGQAIGRLGDFFNRGSFGEYTTFLTRMRLPLDAVSAGQVTDLMRENLQTVEDSSYILVHPTFLYESLWCIFLMVCLMVARRRKLFDGEIFWRYLVGYGLGRAPIEYLRTDKMMLPGVEERIPINLALSIFFVVFGSLVLFVRRSMTRKRLTYRRMRREEGREKEERYLREESRVYLSDIEEEVGLGPDPQNGEHTKGSPLPEDVRHLLEDMEEEQRRFAAEEKERWRKAVAAKEGAAGAAQTSQGESKGSVKESGSLGREETPKENPFAGLEGASSLRRNEKRTPYRPFHLEEPVDGDEDSYQENAYQEDSYQEVPSEEDSSYENLYNSEDQDGQVSREDLEKLFGVGPVRERDYLRELESDLDALERTEWEKTEDSQETLEELEIKDSQKALDDLDLDSSIDSDLDKGEESEAPDLFEEVSRGDALEPLKELDLEEGSESEDTQESELGSDKTDSMDDTLKSGQAHWPDPQEGKLPKEESFLTEEES